MTASETSEVFEMIWLDGAKYVVSANLAAAVRNLQRSWQVEHDERVRLEERLKQAETKVTLLEAAALEGGEE